MSLEISKSLQLIRTRVPSPSLGSLVINIETRDRSESQSQNPLGSETETVPPDPAELGASPTWSPDTCPTPATRTIVHPREQRRGHGSHRDGNRNKAALA